MSLHVVEHPLVEDILARLRDKRTPCDKFRRLSHRLALLLVAEATRDLPLEETRVDTPLETTTVRQVTSRVVAVPVLRAGLGMLDAFLELLPTLRWAIRPGAERDDRRARRYYEKIPKDLGNAVVFLLDPACTGARRQWLSRDAGARGAEIRFSPSSRPGRRRASRRSLPTPALHRRPRQALHDRKYMSRARRFRRPVVRE